MFLTQDGGRNKETLRLAEAIRAKRELDLHADRHGVAAPWKRRTNIFDYAEVLLQHKTPLTKRTYVNALDYLKLLKGDQLTFADISERLCEDFRDFLLSKVKRNTAAAYFARFKSVVNHALKEGYLQRDPAVDLTVRTVETMPRYLTYSQIQQLLAVPCGNNLIRDAFLFSLNTGLRFQDVRDLTWAQIHGDSLEIIQAKTKNAAILPLSESAKAILVRRGGGEQGRIIDNNGRVFPLPRRSTVYKVLNTWAKRTGLGVSICFHTARHSFATLMVSQNVDIYTVSKLLGHKSITTTQIYAKVLDEKKKEAIDRLPMIGG